MAQFEACHNYQLLNNNHPQLSSLKQHIFSISLFLCQKYGDDLVVCSVSWSLTKILAQGSWFHLKV